MDWLNKRSHTHCMATSMFICPLVRLVHYVGIIFAYCNLGFILLVFTIISISYNNIVPTKVITDIWKHGNIATTNSDWTKNMSNRKIRLVVNSLVGSPKRLDLELNLK